MHCPSAIALLIVAIILFAFGTSAKLCGSDDVSGVKPGLLLAGGTFALVLSGWILLWRHTCGRHDHGHGHGHEMAALQL
jgi:hypothetical protein